MAALLTNIVLSCFMILFIQIVITDNISNTNCTDNTNCILHCNDNTMCSDISYLCSINPLYSCTIYCETKDSCSNLTIISSRNTDIYCLESNSCSNIDITITNKESLKSPINANLSIVSSDNDAISMKCDGIGVSECSIFAETPLNNTDIACTDCSLSCDNDIQCIYYCAANDCSQSILECLPSTNNCIATGAGKNDILSLQPTTTMIQTTQLNTLSYSMQIYIKNIEYNQTVFNLILNDDILWNHVTSELYIILQTEHNQNIDAKTRNSITSMDTNDIIIDVQITNISSTNHFDDGLFMIGFICMVFINSQTINYNDIDQYMTNNFNEISNNITSTINSYIYSNYRNVYYVISTTTDSIESDINNNKPTTIHTHHPNHKLGDNRDHGHYEASYIGMGIGLLCMIIIAVVPIRWYLKRQKIDRQNKRNMSRHAKHHKNTSISNVINPVDITNDDTTSKRSRHSSFASISYNTGTGVSSGDITQITIQSKKPEAILYLMSKHGLQASISMNSRQNSMSSNISKITNISSNNNSRKSRNSRSQSRFGQISTISQDRKNVFDGMDQKIDIIQWAEEPEEEDEESMNKENEKEKEEKEMIQIEMEEIGGNKQQNQQSQAKLNDIDLNI